MRKNILYCRLAEAMQDDCCPICALIEKNIHQMMDSFLYESVNDPGLQEKILKSRGFCNHHAEALMKMGDPLGHALLYQRLVQALMEDVRQDVSPDAEHRDCLFCRHAQKMEKDYLAQFADGYHEPEFREAYKKDGMLCRTHLQALSSLLPGLYPQLKADTLEKYGRLLEKLQEIQRKNDYRFASEPWTPGAKDAWKRAVGVVNDPCGIRK